MSNDAGVMPDEAKEWQGIVLKRSQGSGGFDALKHKGEVGQAFRGLYVGIAKDTLLSDKQGLSVAALPISAQVKELDLLR
jgi:hypothetical protein